MPVLMTAPALLAGLSNRGFTLRAVSGRLAVSPATSLTAADRDAIYERRNELLAILSPGEPWNPGVAIRLMHDADTLVEEMGVSGRHPAIADAAATVTSAFATRDMETLRFAMSEFVSVVRRVAHEGVPTDQWDARSVPVEPAKVDATRSSAVV